MSRIKAWEAAPSIVWLGDEGLCQIAVWKMEGLTNDEIAQRLGCSRRTVARKLETIRLIGSGEP